MSDIKIAEDFLKSNDVNIDRWPDTKKLIINVMEGYANQFKLELHTDKEVEDKWISVNERLPDNNKSVLLADNFGRSVTAVFKNNKFLAYSYFTEELDEAEDFHYWQPLPEPPKK